MKMIKSGGSIILTKQVFMQFLLTKKQYYSFLKIILIIFQKSKKLYLIKKTLIGQIFSAKGNNLCNHYLLPCVFKNPNNSLNFGESFSFSISIMYSSHSTL